MAKKTYKVTVDGFTFTRRTDRTYSHVVVSRSNKEADLARAIERAEYDAKTNWAFYIREAGPNPQFANQHSVEQLARYKRIASLTQAQYLAEQVEEATARIADQEANGYYTKLNAFAWCGRLDLAQKQVDQAHKYQLLDVKIVEVPQL